MTTTRPIPGPEPRLINPEISSQHVITYFCIQLIPMILFVCLNLRSYVLCWKGHMSSQTHTTFEICHKHYSELNIGNLHKPAKLFHSVREVPNLH